MFAPGGRSSAFVHHLGIAYIQAFLTQHEYQSTQVIPPTGSTLLECADCLLHTKAPVIGFSVYDTNCYLIRGLAKLLKKKTSPVILVGGPTATFSDVMLLKHIPQIDIAVRFEGEQTTLELLDHFVHGRGFDSLNRIEGITFRQNGDFVQTPDRVFLGHNSKQHDLDTFPSPYLESILDGTEGAGILTARGCIHKCTFCSFSAMSRHTVRFHSINRIINELKIIDDSLRAAGKHQTIPINDDAFSINAQRAKKICRRIIQEDLKLQLSCLCRADNLDEELVILLKEAGFEDISFGLESAVPKVLRSVKKVWSLMSASCNEDFTPEKRFLAQVKNGVALAKKHSMKTTVSIILGLSEETKQDAHTTIDFVQSLDVDAYSHNILVLSPGTELFDNASDYGITVNFQKEFLRYKTHHAYAVREIPFFKNSSVYAECTKVAHLLLHNFSTSPFLLSRNSSGINSARISNTDPSLLRDSLTWLSKHVAVGASVFLFTKNIRSYRELLKVLSIDDLASLNTEHFYVLKHSPTPSFPQQYRFFENNLIFRDFSFPVVSFKAYGRFLKSPQNSSTECYPIVQLQDKQDCLFLSEVAHQLAHQTGSTDAMARLPRGVVEDACRWGRTVCPALNLRKVYIDEENNIKPCPHADAVGTSDEDLLVIKKRLKMLYKKIRRQRNCKECPIETHCSQCLFPFPLTPNDYCQLRRKSALLETFVIHTTIVNTLGAYQ